MAKSIFIMLFILCWKGYSFSSNDYYKIPKDEETLCSYYEFPEKKPFNFKKFKLLTWNIYKQQNKNLQDDLNYLLQYVELANLQEAYTQENFLSYLKSLTRFASHFAASFMDTASLLTGVLNLSTTSPNTSIFIRSLEREPILSTPKMILGQYFTDEETQQDVLVLNIHALNFVTQSQYESQIRQAVQILEQHSGPVVFSGDFNTWNSYRMKFLERELGRLHISRIPLNHQDRMVLDHVFIRGFKNEFSTVLKNITSSDHFPIISALSILPPQ